MQIYIFFWFFRTSIENFFLLFSKATSTCVDENFSRNFVWQKLKKHKFFRSLSKKILAGVQGTDFYVSEVKLCVNLKEVTY